MTREEITAIDPDFEKLVQCVLINNSGKTHKYWHDLWGQTIKPMNEQYRICGWSAKQEELRTHTAYEDMSRILEQLTTLK